jgi:hypothetical protein
LAGEQGRELVGRQYHLTLTDHANHLHEMFGCVGLRDEPHGPELDGLGQEIAFLERSDHDDPDLWMGFEKPPSGLDAVHPGQINVHEHDVGGMLLPRAQCLLGGVEYTGYLDSWFSFQKQPDGIREKPVVIDDRYLEWISHPVRRSGAG